MLDKLKIRIKKEKLLSSNDGLWLLYEWVKTDEVNLKEFRLLHNYYIEVWQH